MSDKINPVEPKLEEKPEGSVRQKRKRRAKTKQKIYIALIGGQEIRFCMENNELVPLDPVELKKQRDPNKPRFFRLRKIPIANKKFQKQRTYRLKNYRWKQENGEWNKDRDSKKETVQAVDDHTALALETMSDTFEEVFE